SMVTPARRGNSRDTTQPRRTGAPRVAPPSLAGERRYAAGERAYSARAKSPEPNRRARRRDRLDAGVLHARRAVDLPRAVASARRADRFRLGRRRYPWPRPRVHGARAARGTVLAVEPVGQGRLCGVRRSDRLSLLPVRVAVRGVGRGVRRVVV